MPLSVVSRLGTRLAYLRARTLSAGMTDEVKQLLLTFAKLKKTARCPTLFMATMFPTRHERCAAVVCSRLRRFVGQKVFDARVDGNRTIRDVLTASRKIMRAAR